MYLYKYTRLFLYVFVHMYIYILLGSLLGGEQLRHREGVHSVLAHTVLPNSLLKWLSAFNLYLRVSFNSSPLVGV